MSHQDPPSIDELNALYGERYIEDWRYNFSKTLSDALRQELEHEFYLKILELPNLMVSFAHHNASVVKRLAGIKMFKVLCDNLHHTPAAPPKPLAESLLTYCRRQKKTDMDTCYRARIIARYFHSAIVTYNNMNSFMNLDIHDVKDSVEAYTDYDLGHAPFVFFDLADTFCTPTRNGGNQ